jgi:hypothetical protein
VRPLNETVCRPIVLPLGWIAGLMLLPLLGPAAQLAFAEPPDSALMQTPAGPEAKSPKAIVEAKLRLQRAAVTKVTTKLDLTIIGTAEFGDWEEPMR